MVTRCRVAKISRIELCEFDPQRLKVYEHPVGPTFGGEHERVLYGGNSEGHGPKSSVEPGPDGAGPGPRRRGKGSGGGVVVDSHAEW